MPLYMHLRTHSKRLITKLKLNGKVDTFIVGAQKAGTSSLHNALCQHDLISDSYMKWGKECQFWNDGPGPRNLEEYRLNFGFKKNGRLLDSTPDYISTPGTLRKIHKYNRKAKFIFLLRNPVERFVSAYNMYHYNFLNRPIWRGIKVYDKRKLEKVIKDELIAAKQNVPTNRQYLYRGNYAHQITNEFFGIDKSQIFIAIIEQDMYKSWEVFSFQIQEFLEVDPITLNLPRENSSSGRAKISDHNTQILYDYYTEKNQKLEEILQRDLKIWRQKNDSN